MKGVRQAGKTWILQNLMLASGQKILPEKTLIIFDEIQKAPELFEQIKIMCDETEERGLFWLTGSWQYKMMKNIRDTLAGRIGILELYSLSKMKWTEKFLQTNWISLCHAFWNGRKQQKRMILWMCSSIFGAAGCSGRRRHN